MITGDGAAPPDRRGQKRRIATALAHLGAGGGVRWWRWALVVVLLVAAALRLLYLDRAPFLVNQDELSNIYDATCLAQTGADRWGRPHPVLLRGFGDLDYRPALQAWLTAVPMRWSGFSAGAGRAVSGVIGTLTVLLIGLLAPPLLGRGGALVAVVVVMLSPWHLLFSRMAHEGAALPPLFVALALFLWQRARARRYAPRGLLLLGLALGAATNAYQASRLVAVALGCLVVGEVGCWVWRLPARWRKALPGLLALAAGALLAAAPQVWAAASEGEHFFARAREQVITAGAPLDFVWKVARNGFANLGAEYLFFSSGTYNNLSMGRALPVEAPFFYLGLAGVWWWLPRARRRRWTRVVVILAICLLPAALTDAEPHALRASGASVLIGLFSTLGWLGLGAGVRLWTLGARTGGDAGADSWRWRRPWLVLGAAGAVACGAVLCTAYWRSEAQKSAGHQPELVLMGKWLGQHGAGWERVIVQPMGVQPYLYVAAFGGMSPAEFQAAPKQFEGGGWYEFRRLGKYEFGAIGEALARWRAAGFPRSLVVLDDLRPVSGRVIGEVVTGRHRIVFSELAEGDSTPGVLLGEIGFDSTDCAFAPPVVDATWTGGPLGLQGVYYPSGIGMHAPCRATVCLPSGEWRLQALAGVGDSARECALGLVRLAVRGDGGALLAQSELLRAAGSTWEVDVDLSGQAVVTLEADEGGNGRDCDHVVWADARLVPASHPATSRPHH